MMLQYTNFILRGSRGRMVVGFAYLSPLRLWVRILLNTTLCNKVCQWLGTGQWFSLFNPWKFLHQ